VTTLRFTAMLLSVSAVVSSITSCVAALGLDEENKDAVERFCKCPDLITNAYANDSSPAGACVTDLRHDLEIATEATRAAWLKKYESTCARDCQKWQECFNLLPTCRKSGEACSDSVDLCCSHTCGGDGRCVGD